MGNDWEWNNNYTQRLEAYNDEMRRIAKEERGILSNDNRTRMQKKLDSLSLAAAWDYYAESKLRIKVESTYYVEGHDAARRMLKSGAYKEKNPYKDGGDEVFLRDYIFDEYGFLERFDGWSTEGKPNFNTLDGFKRMPKEKALEIARRDGARLFRKEGSTYTRIK